MLAVVLFAALAALRSPRALFGARLARGSDEVDPDNNECVVCMDDVESVRQGGDAEVVCLNNHVLHKECLQGVLKSGGETCPECRAPLLQVRKAAMGMEIKRGLQNKFGGHIQNEIVTSRPAAAKGRRLPTRRRR